jgi:uncharacterized membrane protein
MPIRTPTKIELVIQGLLVVFLAVVLVDFFQALDATACTAPNPSPNCYPWGMTEGPMEGGSWGYSSQANYLISSGVGMVVLAMAAMAPFFARGRRSGLIARAGILVLGPIGFWLAA